MRMIPTSRIGAVSAGVLLAVVLLLSACGSSSSSSKGAAADDATTTSSTIPTPAQAASSCQKATSAVGSLIDAANAGSSAMDYSALGGLLDDVRADAEQCQAAVKAASPKLSAEGQTAATSYSGALGAVLPLLELAPTDPDMLSVWTARMSAVLGPLTAAQGALAQADPLFAN